MIRIMLAVIVLVAALLAPAAAQLPTMGVGPGAFGGGGGGGGSNDLLLVNGASYLLQTNATSKICLAGGC